MQRLFGRFGKNSPEPTVSPPDLRKFTPDEFDFPITAESADDEETNWDDEETLQFDRNPFPQLQPIVRVETLPPVPTTSPDLDNWDEALPAATVKNSNTQEARRAKNAVPASEEDLWDENIPTVTFPIDNNSPPSNSSPSQMERAVGIWAATLQQLRRILPRQLRQLSDAILTAIVVTMLTVTIWFVDGLLAAQPHTQITTTSAAPAMTSSSRTDPEITVTTTPQISPEQAFVAAIQTQLSDITIEYPDNIIQSLQVDLPRNLAIVSLNPVWYLIDNDRQNLVTDRMWLQARTNHFAKLELKDAQGLSIARSPVVGSHMVILHRRQSS